jgi:hypothetical protein
MMLRNRFKNSTLLWLGLGLMAIRANLQVLVDRTSHSNDLTDFALGVLMGLGAGLTMLAVWRIGRRQRDESNGACTGAKR